MSRPAISLPGSASTALPPVTPAKRTGVIVGGIVAGVAVLALAGYLGYRMLFGGESPNRAASVDSSPPVSTATIAPAEAPKDAAPPPAPTGTDTASTQTSAALPPDSEAKPVSADAGKGTSSGTDASKGPGKDTGKASSMTAAAKDAAKDSGKAPPLVPGSPPATTDTTKSAAGAAPPQQTAQTDRWKLMRDAMARCGGETFFKRVSCEQAVGLQYCEGYWGRVPQCPSGPPKDRGQ